MNGYMLDEEDPKLLNTLTPGTSQQQAPPTIAPPVMAPPPMAQVPQLPPVQAPPPQVPPKLPGMPQGIGPNELEQYLAQQKQSLNKYGPEDVMATQQANDAQRNSLGSRATSGLKGLADAIMMGVAGQGNPGWQKQYEDQQNLQSKERMDALKEARSSNMQGIEANMSLDSKNAKSPLSKEKQESYGPLFEKLGYPPASIQTMSASDIDNAMNLMAQFGGKQVEAMIKKYELELQGAQFGEVMRHNRAAEENQATGDKRAAAESIIKGSNIPFIGPTHSQKVEATNYLASQATNQHPQSSEALKWAESNPSDPRSAEILKRLGK